MLMLQALITTWIEEVSYPQNEETPRAYADDISFLSSADSKQA